MELKTTVLTAMMCLALSSVTTAAEIEQSGTKPATAESTAAAKGEGTPANAKPAAPAAPATKLSNNSDLVAVSGKVVETFDGGSYTYFLVEKEGKQSWVAVPTYQAKVGDEISFRPGIQMGKFKSDRLNRTFDNIIFSAGPVLPEGTKGNDDFLMKRAHGKKMPAPEATPAAGVKPAPAAAADVTAEPKPEPLTGKVVEKLDGGGYSYFLLEKEGKKTWVAAPPTEGKIGETLSFQPGFEMKSFKSKTLDRTFESIIFTDGPASGDAKADQDLLNKKAHAGLAKDAAKSADQAGKSLDVTVAKAAAPNGFTVAELYAKSGELNGREVVVQGRVVKVSRQIMGKNWVHLQDGSGDAAAGTSNLVTTTKDSAAVGDLVVATGTLAKDKDFGGGYQYSVIIEETKLVKK